MTYFSTNNCFVFLIRDLIIFYFLFLQRTGPADIYGSTKPQMKHPIADRGGGIGSAEYRGQTLADELMNDFSDNDETPLTEPIYNGR